MPVEINYLLDKLYKIDKSLGGTAQSGLIFIIGFFNLIAKGGGDEVNNIKEACIQRMHALRKKIEEREKKGRTAEGIRLDVEMKDIVGEIEMLLNKMNEVIRK